MNADTNSIIYAYLVDQTALTVLVGTRINVPRLEENQTLPAIGFFTRGGRSNPHIEKMVSPSVQFDCWADTPNGARAVYRNLVDVLQGIQNVDVTIDGSTYRIMGAVEETLGQDLQDVAIPFRFRVMTFFLIMIRPVTI